MGFQIIPVCDLNWSDSYQTFRTVVYENMQFPSLLTSLSR